MTCPNCGQEIQNESVFCGCCGYKLPEKEQMRPVISETNLAAGKPKRFNLLSLILVVAVVALGVLCIVFGSQVSEKNAEISELNSTIQTKDQKIKTLQTERDAAKKKADNYSQVVKGVKNGNNGKGADHFKVNYPVVYLNKGVTKKVKLTAHWASGGTVSYYSDKYGIADVELAEDSWTESVTVEITGLKEGVAVYTFTNNKDKYKFNMIVIVE